MGQPARSVGGATRRRADVTWSAKGMPFFISGSDKLRISTEDAYREGVGGDAERHDGGQVLLFLLCAQLQ